MKCWFCQAEVPPGEKRCPNCRVEMSDAENPPFAKCPKCGKVLTTRDPSGQFYCKECGLFVPRPGKAPQPESETPTAKPDQPAPPLRSKPSPVKPGCAIGCLSVLVIAIIFGVIAAVSDSPDTETPKLKSPGQALASIDHGEYLEEADLRIIRYQAVMDRLSQKCGESPERIGDMAITAQRELKKHDMDYQLLRILEGVDDLIPNNPQQKIDTAQIFGLYVAAAVYDNQ